MDPGIFLFRGPHEKRMENIDNFSCDLRHILKVGVGLKSMPDYQLRKGGGVEANLDNTNKSTGFFLRGFPK